MTIIDLRRGELLALDARAGGTLEVLFGRIWLTETGRPDDVFAGSGEQVRLVAGGRVLVETPGFARLLMPATVPPRRHRVRPRIGGRRFALPSFHPINRGATMKSLNLLAAAALLGACATPTVVETRRSGDTILSCDQLRYELAEADRFEKEARAERKVTGTNVAAAVFFWPALLATYSNSDQAITAARERKAHLYKLADARKCGV